jgi:vacuolar-type H+-ATPase subunit I/STV1
MKKIFILWMLVCFAMICSCRKQDSAAEQQLGQQKAELDAREKALDERLNALDEKVSQLDQRVRALASQEKAIAAAQTVPPDVQSQDVMRDVTQMKALMSDPSRLNSARAEKDRLTHERHAQREATLGTLQTQRPPKSKIAGMAVLPTAESSPSPSPTPQ